MALPTEVFRLSPLGDRLPEEGNGGRAEGPPQALASLRVWDDPEPRSAALNMALDEVLLRHAGEAPDAGPVLRFYGWARRAVSFGYFDRWEIVRERFPRAEEWVRRWTGGGAVDHAEDLTLSLALPAAEPLVGRGSQVIYQAIHAALLAALNHLGVADARLADGSDATPTPPGEAAPCFVAPVTADVLASGRKVAGGAQRRTRAGVLHQGSVQGIEGPRLGPEFRSAFAAMLATRTGTGWEPPPAWLDEARALAAERYATPDWNQRR